MEEIGKDKNYGVGTEKNEGRVQVPHGKESWQQVLDGDKNR